MSKLKCEMIFFSSHLWFFAANNRPTNTDLLMMMIIISHSRRNNFATRQNDDVDDYNRLLQCCSNIFFGLIFFEFHSIVFRNLGIFSFSLFFLESIGQFDVRVQFGKFSAFFWNFENTQKFPVKNYFPKLTRINILYSETYIWKISWFTENQPKKYFLHISRLAPNVGKKKEKFTETKCNDAHSGCNIDIDRG